MLSVVRLLVALEMLLLPAWAGVMCVRRAARESAGHGSPRRPISAAVAARVVARLPSRGVEPASTRHGWASRPD